MVDVIGAQISAKEHSGTPSPAPTASAPSIILKGDRCALKAIKVFTPAQWLGG
jgi:hypothetical protein